MSIYENRPERRHYEVRDALKLIDAEPCEVYRDREVAMDKFRDKTVQTVGPLRMRLDGFKHTRVAYTFDEKGGASAHAFTLLGVDLPVGTFQLMDTIRVNGKRYRVTSPVERRLRTVLVDGQPVQQAQLVEVTVEQMN